MKRIIAYDGGGTKTQAAAYDGLGNRLFEKTTTGSNYLSVKTDGFKAVIGSLFHDILKTLDWRVSDVDFIVLGLSGADNEKEHALLESLCSDVFGDIPFRVVNDAWIVLRSGLKNGFGATAISGTGTNSAALAPNGERAILRSYGYTSGTYGGGLDIAREALHHAFRADERSGPMSALLERIPRTLGLSDINAVAQRLHPDSGLTREDYGNITALVMDVACEGDAVALGILERIGRSIGEQTAGVILRVGIEDAAVPVVIGGKVFTGKCPVLIEHMMEAIHQVCPSAYLVRPPYPPVTGAYLMALDALGIEQTDLIEDNLVKGGVRHG